MMRRLRAILSSTSGSTGPDRRNPGAAKARLSPSRRSRTGPTPHSCTISSLFGVPPDASQALRLPSLTATSVNLTSAQALSPGHRYVWWIGAVSTNGQVTVWGTAQVFTVTI